MSRKHRAPPPAGCHPRGNPPRRLRFEGRGGKGGAGKRLPEISPVAGSLGRQREQGSHRAPRDRGCERRAGALLVALLNAEATTSLPPNPPWSLAAAAQGGPGAPPTSCCPRGAAPGLRGDARSWHPPEGRAQIHPKPLLLLLGPPWHQACAVPALQGGSPFEGGGLRGAPLLLATSVTLPPPPSPPGKGKTTRTSSRTPRNPTSPRSPRPPSSCGTTTRRKST